MLRGRVLSLTRHGQVEREDSLDITVHRIGIGGKIFPYREVEEREGIAAPFRNIFLSKRKIEK